VKHPQKLLIKGVSFLLPANGEACDDFRFGARLKWHRGFAGHLDEKFKKVFENTTLIKLVLVFSGTELEYIGEVGK
jgi:hypothetical protein